MSRPSRSWIAASILILSILSFVPIQAEKLAAVPNYRMGTVTYETGFDFEDYNDIRDNYTPVSPELRPWGEHPIIWKHIINPGLSFDPWTLDPNQGPILFLGVPGDLVINPGDSVALNNYEVSGAFTSGGNTVNPTGSWLETSTVDGEEAAILAAMAIWEWNSPVYLNFQYFPASAPVPSLVGVIDSVTLSVPSGVPHVVCGWDDPDPSTSCPGLVIESVKMTYYSDVCLCGDPEIVYFDAPAITGAEFVALYETSWQVGPVLWDPPVSLAVSEAIAERFEQASRAQAAGAFLRGEDGALYQPQD